MRQRRPEHHQRRIPLEFVYESVVQLRGTDHASEEVVEQSDYSIRRVSLGQRGRTDQIDEQHCNFAEFTAECRLLLYSSSGDGVADVHSEQ